MDRREINDRAYVLPISPTLGFGSIQRGWQIYPPTRNFHLSNKIGKGGFGVVHREVLRDGTQVAIKILSSESKQEITEFLKEINMISSIHHKNLVELIGGCVEGTNRILVYEYLENNMVS